MTYRIGQTWNRALAGLLALGIGHSPALFGQTLAFEVASVKPHAFARNEFSFGTASVESPIRISGNRVSVRGLLPALVQAAYKLRTFQVSGAPEWHDETGRNQVYDIEGKAPGEGAPTMDQVRKMLQTLLAERFQLQFHRETKELPSYGLTVNNGSKLKPSAPDAESKIFRSRGTRMVYTNVAISDLVLQIGPQFDRPLFDKTGLTGGYDFSLEYTPSLPSTVSLPPELAAEYDKRLSAGDAPPLPVALQQQLGLKVVASKEQVEILVIDRVERPSAN